MSEVGMISKGKPFKFLLQLVVNLVLCIILSHKPCSLLEAERNNIFLVSAEDKLPWSYCNRCFLIPSVILNVWCVSIVGNQVTKWT
jgi:hypothetical protein